MSSISDILYALFAAVCGFCVTYAIMYLTKENNRLIPATIVSAVLFVVALLALGYNAP